MRNMDKLYNIALDCIDKNAQSLHNKHKPALLYVKEGAAPLRLTFANLEGLSNHMANAFLGLGLEKGQRVVLRLPNCPEFPIAFLGAIKAGLVPIPSSPQFTWRELEFILADSEASAFVTAKDLLPAEIEGKPASLRHILCLAPRDWDRASPASGLHRFQDLLKNSSPQFSTAPTSGEEAAFWLYTSGTEGRPKAVIHAHRSIPAHDARAKLWQDLRFNDVVFNTSALHWSYALTAGLLDLWRHGLPSLIYDGPPSAERICQLVKHFGITTFMSVPGIYRRLAEYLSSGDKGHPFAQVRVCNSAGEKLSPEIREKFRANTGREIYEGLGMSEHSVYLVQRAGEPPVEASCGQALPGQRISIVDEEGRELPAGTEGILASHRSCAGLMLGYHRRPEEEAACWKGDWFLSGDMAQRDEAGNFYFLGRRDDVITAGGHRISPLEIEAILNAIPGVRESAAIGQEIEAGRTAVSAFVVAEKKAPAELEARIQAELEKSLAAYKRPKSITFVESLPKTGNGKLQRKQLR